MTVFGGHHLLLGHLVMKHGGHKDLIELVSLAMIEREMGMRARPLLLLDMDGSRTDVDMSKWTDDEGMPMNNEEDGKVIGNNERCWRLRSRGK